METSPAEYQRDDFLAGIPPPPEDEFCVFGTVYAHPEHADALEAVYAETTRVSASEPGILYYCLARDQDDRNVFHFFERYTGRRAFEEHNDTPTVRKLLADGLIKGVKAKFVKAIQPAGSGST
ncbi:hypothetical protein CKM354_000529500 [Cercospora kikuchii]|uniref:ABM domain-containing protein n=1 Tax=Cercospora kikuchii TaxID=84275 RepID=A0A9P3FGM9_9PEZI|nr:uncharacterized protein CKM354_000529500 [Cercospora kikuchii]GIZ42014.1 hypothetical protein CKM354_000529500 [Cercospora kikuchii]